MRLYLSILFLFVLACSHSRSESAAVSQAVITPAWTTVTVDATSPATNPWAKSIGDVNGDGLPDLLICGGSSGEAFWYANPTWTVHAIGGGGGTESGSAVGDIDQDGDLDFLCGDQWHENVGHGTSWVTHNIPDRGSHDISLVDLNADGRLDIVMRGESDDKISVIVNAGGASDNWPEIALFPGVGHNGLDVADINADGKPDIVISGKWYQNPGGDVLANTWALHTFATWNDYASVKIVDMNADGRPDVVLSVSEAVTVATGPLSWFEAPVNPVTGTWIQHVIATGLTCVHAFVVSDFNQDGALDVMASEYQGPGRMLLFTNGGTGTSWAQTVLATDSIHNVRGADLNGDGVVDFFGARSEGNPPVLAYLSDTGSGGSGSGGALGSGGAASGGQSGGTPGSGGAADGGSPASGGASGGAVADGGSAGSAGASAGSGGAAAGSSGMGAGGAAGSASGGSAGSAGSAGASAGTAGNAGSAGASTSTIGEPAILNTDDCCNGGYVLAQKATLSHPATINSLSFYVTVAAGKLLLGIYASNTAGTNPTTLKAATAEFTPVVGWNTVNVTTPVSLTSGSYWLAYTPQSGSLGFRIGSGGNIRYYARSYQALPATFATSATSYSGHWSFYGTVTP